MRTVAFVVAIILGIVAIVGVRSYIKSQQREIRKEQKLVDVIVAKKPIDSGEPLTRDKVGTVKKPAASLGGLDISYLELERYLGRKLNRNVDRGTPILVSHFVEREPERASGAIAEGKRALTIAVDTTSGVAGLINPADSVDIMATMTVAAPEARASAASPRTWRVLSDVTVLAVDDRLSSAPATFSSPSTRRRGYGTITLAVTPQEAQMLVFLKEHAKLTFVLRSQSEVGQRRRLPPVTANNVVELAREANKNRQQEIEELEQLPPSVPLED